MSSDLYSKNRITAILGPTNTGKTYMAVERMLAYESGLIGFPLRLLAREVYDKVVAIEGKESVALITGEEKITPKNPHYILATVEAMPLDRTFDFLAIDEIQLSNDRERGHVFTDRLLNARGVFETMFLGADTIRSLIRKLVPEASFISRPRYSELSYRGCTKLHKLAPRSAIVAFSAQDVYSIAEIMREQRGGCAVVLGALSPRTRNAQVEMYQSGDVDYLIATDAIGMGLNIDLEHVAFSANRKFDGRNVRQIEAAEVAQIAGRAGRYLSNGTFGTTDRLSGFEKDIVDAVEQHRFLKIKEVSWRNTKLVFSSLDHLLASLDVSPPLPGLRQIRDGNDHLTLLALTQSRQVQSMAQSEDSVRLLWEVCQIPDFRRTLAESHFRLVEDIYYHLVESGSLPETWISERIRNLDRCDGDIDTLTTRISHVRTLTYISHRATWLQDARAWQDLTRDLEDRLSDALHERLTQRFVDRRAAALLRGMQSNSEFSTTVNEHGIITIEGHSVGRLEGFRFLPEDMESASKVTSTAAQKVLITEIGRRVNRLAEDKDEVFSLAFDAMEGEATTNDARLIYWRGSIIGTLIKSKRVLQPGFRLLYATTLTGPQRERIRQRLIVWLNKRIEEGVKPLFRLQKANLRAAARGIGFQVCESLGCLPRSKFKEDTHFLNLTAKERAGLKKLGIHIGYISIYCGPMIKFPQSEFARLLWSVNNAVVLPKREYKPSAVGFTRDKNVPTSAYNAMGYVVLGTWVLRADMTERLASALKEKARSGPFILDPKLFSLAGCDKKKFSEILKILGYKIIKSESGAINKSLYISRVNAMNKTRNNKRRKANKIDPNSPFAELGSYFSLQKEQKE